jgi:hypothetical protein
MKPIQKLPTRTGNPITRFSTWLWDLCERKQWVPLAIVGVLLIVVNQ